MKKNLKFYITSFLLLIFIFSYLLSYFFITERYEKIILNELQSTAKILAQQILITRKWVALHGAVLVKKDKDIEPNPFLEEPYVVDEKGRIFVKMNPAFVTREIAKLAEKEKGFHFRVVSLKAVNPKNSPDEFERSALLDFDSKKISEKTSLVGKTFRYIIPLYVEDSCLKCHKNYNVGDVRGALSIFLPSDELLLKLKNTKFLFFLILTFFHIVIFLGFWSFLGKFIVDPINKLAKYAMGNENLEDSEFNVAELLVLFENLRDSKIKDKKIKEILEEEIEKATRELRSLNEKKSDFLLQIGHKLKTPLTVIATSIDYLLMKGSCSEEEKYLNLLKRNVSSLKRAVNQILKSAQLDMGITDNLNEKISLKVLIEEIIQSFGGYKIKIHCPVDLWVYGCYEMLYYLFENLIHNAIKFNKPEGEVIIDIERIENFALIKVRDEGVGIREEDKTKVFDKFYHRDRENREKGTGLGLYIAKYVTEMHNGEIWFETEINKGTTFFVKLPLIEVENGKNNTDN
ncbi:MAG: DUF3365 domain-containing protein [Proteobacteria bacterium]|nr:DUF3365 domain-containing protein [Pseudomonadota bacterium]